MENTVISPDALRKEELLAEFHHRGVTEGLNSDLPGLVAKSKEIKLFMKPPIAKYNNTGELDEKTRIVRAIEEFSEILGDFESMGVTDKQFRRINHRLLHWRNRNYFLRQITDNLDILNSQQENEVCFSDLMQRLMKLRFGCSGAVAGGGTHFTSGAAVSGRPIDSEAEHPAFQNHVENLLDFPDNVLVTEPVVGISSFTTKAPAPNLDMSGGNQMIQDRNFVRQSVNEIFRIKTLELSNPLQELINDMPMVEFSNAEEVFKFLKFVVKLQKLAGSFSLETCQLLQVLHSRAKGDLASLINEALNNGRSMLEFQESVIKFFLSAKVLHELIAKYYFRSQLASESFLTFIEDVETVSLALMVPYTESEAVAMVGAAARLSEVRALFLGYAPPTTWIQLKQLAYKLNDTPVNRDQDIQLNSNNTERAVHSRVGSVSNNFQGSRNERRNFFCNGCKRPGHTIDRCWNSGRPNGNNVSRRGNGRFSRSNADSRL